MDKKFPFCNSRLLRVSRTWTKPKRIKWTMKDTYPITCFDFDTIATYMFAWALTWTLKRRWRMKIQKNIHTRHLHFSCLTLELKLYRLWYTKCNLTLVTGHLLHTITIPNVTRVQKVQLKCIERREGKEMLCTHCLYQWCRDHFLPL